MTLTLLVPSPANQIFTSRAATSFKAKIDPDKGYVERVEFMITTEYGAPVWHWAEYEHPYCAFGEEHPKICDEAPEGWWNALANGTYHIKAVAFTGRDELASVEQTFIKQAPVSSATATPTATPSVTPTPTATSTNVPTPTPTTTVIATPETTYPAPSAP